MHPLLDPMPERTGHQFPKPVKILSKRNLYTAWKGSRDATSNPGRPGIDGITAEQFALRADERLAALSDDLRKGRYFPSRLKAVFIPKPYSTKERLICIPIIRDRIVQRTIANYLVLKDRFQIENEFSFGFIKGRGTNQALTRALELRQTNDWCLKTDIETFFDKISRNDAKEKVSNALKGSSVTPLIQSFIDCEIKSTPLTRTRLKKQGVVSGIGLRQGMPLSPILANLVLADFDASFKNERIKMVRYADDLLLFFASKAAAQDGFTFVKSQLSAQGLTIPDLGGEDSKTQIVAPKQPVYFLGLELVYVDSVGGYVKRVGRKQLAKIEQRLEEEYSYETLRKEKINFQQAVADLGRSIASYMRLYQGVYDYPRLDSELRRIARKVLGGIFEDVFGAGVLENITDDQKDFLGLGPLEFPDVGQLEL